MPEMPHSMNALDTLYSWATGGDHPYPSLAQCFNTEPALIWQFMAVSSILGLGNVVTSVRWFRAARQLPRSSERWAMSMMFAIFLLTALTCDFLVLVKMYWPIWRLQLCMMWAVAAHTWLFILHPRWFPSIVTHMGKAEARVVARNHLIGEELKALRAHFAGQRDGRLEPV